MPKRGLWNNEEEDALISFVKSHGVHSWKEIKDFQPLQHRTSSQCQSKYSRLKRQRKGIEKETESIPEEESTEGEEEEEEEETQGTEAEPAEDEEEETEEISVEVPENRRDEIKEFLQLFGYNPNTTVLQVHIPGKFGRGGSVSSLAREAAKERYGGTTFIVVGRTHDPNVKKIVQPPISQSASYFGYLHKGADPKGRAPHELLPLDFTPSGFDYPETWRQQMPGGSGWLITMHVPAAFAKDKNALMAAIRKAGKTQNAEDKWEFVDTVKPHAFKRKT